MKNGKIVATAKNGAQTVVLLYAFSIAAKGFIDMAIDAKPVLINKFRKNK